MMATVGNQKSILISKIYMPPFIKHFLTKKYSRSTPGPPQCIRYAIQSTQDREVIQRAEIRQK
jgi:hypothetical protein